VTLRRWLALALVLLGGVRAEAQGRVVPPPTEPTRKARVVPAPGASQPRKPRPQAKPKATATKPARSRAQVPVRTPVPAPATPENRPPAAIPAPGGPGNDLSVTLITFGPGPVAFERFGHNALWIHDGRRGTDVAYNWGLFSFDQPGFYRRFLTGDTKYWMAGEDAYAMVAAYHNAGRSITLQKLNLSPAQAYALREAVERNALEANKYYRYDYFRDNCSTRLRDAVDRAVGGALRAATDTMRTALTYRGESERLTEGDVPLQAGIDIALGRPADAPLSAWESFFIPMRLRDAVRIVRIPGAYGEMVPLVAEERRMAPAAGAPSVQESRTIPQHTRRNLIAGLVLAAVVMLLRLLMRSQRWAAWLFALLGMAWSLLCGTLGVVLLLAWFATKHVFWAQNENLLLFSPLSLALVALVPSAVLAGRAVRRARVVGALVAAMALGALVLSQMPGGQPIRDVVALALPMHLALAWALLLYLPRRSEPKPAPKR